MATLPIDKLYQTVINEYESRGSIFGIDKGLFFNPDNFKELQFKRYGQLLETPLGVAAGPHTQLSQNIISSWLVGARYIELKTVQTLDQLEVSKPCIDMEDEGYNCEWSQELLLEESFREYLNAWIMIHILREKLNFKNSSGELGTIFNMSVGYNLQGILNDNVQNFLNKMKDCSKYKLEAIEILRPYYPQIDSLLIADTISNNITLSTMHGCPPDEIEKIGLYLIEELKVHTTIKLNPTLNGAKELRDILNNKLGFKDVNVPDIAFEHDLKYPDAVKIITNLIAKAKKTGVDFSIKLTNTLETTNQKGYFDKSNEMMYLSGRPLHPLAINLANKLQNDFAGKLDISFSSGADSFNIVDILAQNIKPVTICSDLLKPGGYARISQYLFKIKNRMLEHNYRNFNELVLKSAKLDSLPAAILANLKNYLPRVIFDRRYHKRSFPWKNIKNDRPLHAFDCIQAPCQSTCPTKQDIPDYIYLTMVGEYARALEVVRRTNPFPNATGFACDHICEDSCTRINYDSPVRIRDIKRFLAVKENNFPPITPKRSLDIKVGIIGGGPSGLSAAYFLALEGFRVELFEAKEIVGGMLTHALPDFRVQKEKVELDIRRIRSLGVKIYEKSPVDAEQYEIFQHRFDYIYISVGASLSKGMGISGEQARGVIPFLEFLERVKLKTLTKLPEKVVVIGGGNSAIDAVRTAKRLMTKEGSLKLIYRRTKDEMPASPEEIEELLEERIDILELTAPSEIILESSRVKAIRCVRMQLSDADQSGRRRPVEIPNSHFDLPVDMIIPAIGQEVDRSSLAPNLELTSWGTIKTAEYQTLGAKIFSGGDVVRGPSSIIKGVADGKELALKIMLAEGVDLSPYEPIEKKLSLSDIRKRRAQRKNARPLPKSDPMDRKNFNLVVETFSDEEANLESQRCLMCNEICEVCVTVCPNRANVTYQVEPKKYNLRDITVADGKISYGQEYFFNLTQKYQVANIGDFCNECANCVTFCPSAGRPHADKPKIYISPEAFAVENSNAFHFVREQRRSRVLAKIDGKLSELTMAAASNNYIFSNENLVAELNREDLTISSIELISGDCKLAMSEVSKMAILLEAEQQLHIC